MHGIEFIWPHILCEHNPLLDEIPAELAVPEPYIDENPLSEHMANAVRDLAVGLSEREHVNFKSQQPFKCISYYSDDPEVVAYCDGLDHLYFATVGVPFVRRLVGICNRIGPILDLGPWFHGPPHGAGAKHQPDETLRRLMAEETSISESKALEIVSSWPSADTASAQLDLGEYALFYDLIRLIWVHEWAHALCGHVSFASRNLHMMQLNEVSADRIKGPLAKEMEYSRAEILQGIEMHADEFAARYCVGQILWGYDPIGRIAGPVVNLGDRLLIFNIACCIFAILWSLLEKKYEPGISFYPSPASSDPEASFTLVKNTHPPAALRYLRFRGFQRDLTAKFSKENNQPLFSYVDGQSYKFLSTLSSLDWHFDELFKITPLLVATPTIEVLEEYEAHLRKVAESFAPMLEELNYIPTNLKSEDRSSPE